MQSETVTEQPSMGQSTIEEMDASDFQVDTDVRNFAREKDPDRDADKDSPDHDPDPDPDRIADPHAPDIVDPDSPEIVDPDPPNFDW